MNLKKVRPSKLLHSKTQLPHYYYHTKQLRDKRRLPDPARVKRPAPQYSSWLQFIQLEAKFPKGLTVVLILPKTINSTLSYSITYINPLNIWFKSQQSPTQDVKIRYNMRCPFKPVRDLYNKVCKQAGRTLSNWAMQEQCLGDETVDLIQYSRPATLMLPTYIDEFI